MLKAVEHTNTKPPIFKGVFDLQNRVNIVWLCQLLPLTTMYQALYLFFCMSNLVPILFEQMQAVIIMKWSKTLLTINKGTYVIIPRLSQNVFCPVKALEDMFTEFPASRNAPLLSHHLATLTETQVRTFHFKWATC